MPIVGTLKKPPPKTRMRAAVESDLPSGRKILGANKKRATVKMLSAHCIRSNAHPVFFRVSMHASINHSSGRLVATRYCTAIAPQPAKKPSAFAEYYPQSAHNQFMVTLQLKSEARPQRAAARTGSPVLPTFNPFILKCIVATSILRPIYGFCIKMSARRACNPFV